MKEDSKVLQVLLKVKFEDMGSEYTMKRVDKLLITLCY